MPLIELSGPKTAESAEAARPTGHKMSLAYKLGLTTEQIKNGLALVDKRQRHILTLHFSLDGGEPQAQSAIAKNLAVLQHTISVIEQDAITRIFRSIHR